MKNKDGFRVCVTCKIEKPLSSEYYHSDKNRFGGLMYRCKECEKIRKGNDLRHNRWLKMNPAAREKVRANHKRYAKTPMGKAISFLNAYRKSDSKKGTTTTITKHDIIDARNQPCHYCGFDATGFDRIDNTLGHTIENCVPCCADCNIVRMDNFSEQEMLLIGQSIRFIKAERERKVHGICML